MPNTLTKRGGPRAVADAARRPALAAEGIVVAIVAVTGTEDSVQDVIAPGAFADTLTRRKPKFCWMHKWDRPLGRILSMVELKPGDRRLPKTTPDGRKWPAAAGALIATMQFNLKTSDGRDFYEHAKMWAEGGEAAFSIGYKVMDGMASKRGDGVRVIYALELYECSLVLHGAHNMALALEVKHGDTGAMLASSAPVLEYKDADMTLPPAAPQSAPAQPDHSEGVMVALYPDDAAAEKIAVAGGLDPSELHVTIAYLGKGPIDDPAALSAQIAPAVAAVGPLSGSVGGLGQFPPGDDGTPVWAPVDVPGLDGLRTAVTGALADAGHPQTSDHGFTPHMTLGYDLTGTAPVPSTPVAFTDVYLVVGGNRYPLPLSQPEAPLEAKSILATLARSLGRHGLLAHLEAKSLHPATPTETNTTPTTTQEVKSMAYMKGSQEERRKKLELAVEDLLLPKNDNDGDSDGMVAEGSGWVCIDATFDAYVIATRHAYRGEPDTYRLDYSWTGENVTLGIPEPVELSIVATPEAGDPGILDEGVDVRLRFVEPATSAIDDAARFIGALPEGKGLEELSTPVLMLLDALAVKGYDVARAVMGDEEEDPYASTEGDEEDEESMYDYAGGEESSELPTAEEDQVMPDVAAGEESDPSEVEPDGDADDEEDEDTVHLDPEAVRAQMAALRAA